jgi:hypothetical protein
MMLGEEIKVIDWPNARALPLLTGGIQTPPPAPTGRPRD